MPLKMAKLRVQAKFPILLVRKHGVSPVRAADSVGIAAISAAKRREWIIHTSDTASSGAGLS